MLTNLEHGTPKTDALNQMKASVPVTHTFSLVNRAADTFIDESYLETSLSPASVRNFRTERPTSIVTRGGWPSSQPLTRAQVEELIQMVRKLCVLGSYPTHHITIMPSARTDSARKAICRRKIGHIGQALKRHQKAHVGLTVYERRPDADLHAHHILHVPSDELATMARFHRPPEVHIKAVWDLDTLIEYLTKEHAPRISAERRWEPGGFVPGKRWTTTKFAMAM